MVSRDFGLGVATRVAYSKLSGIVWPNLALPDGPPWNATPRELSILLSTAEHDAAMLSALIEALAAHGRPDWEICISARLPAQPETVRTLARLCGTQPWLRVVSTDQAIDETTAAQWTTEQATGEFVALLSAGYRPDLNAIATLLAGLRGGTGPDAAVLLETGSRSTDAPSNAPRPGVRLVLQRKSAFLAFLPRSLISAAALVRELDRAAVPVMRT
jgi:hypothetical protein